MGKSSQEAKGFRIGSKQTIPESKNTFAIPYAKITHKGSLEIKSCFLMVLLGIKKGMLVTDNSSFI